MRKYEMMIIFDLDNPVDETKTFLYDTFKSNSISIIEEKDMGVRNLAYEINRKQKGHYFLFNLEADQTKLISINKEFKLHKGIMRQITLKQDK